MDVDGTITPGYVCLQTFPDSSVAEMKMFNAHDGAGIKLAGIMGIRTGLITGRDSPATTRRARENRRWNSWPGPAEKTRSRTEGILAAAGVTDEEVAYLGDDIPDLPILQRVGLAVAVADAVVEVKRAAHYMTPSRRGRHGARGGGTHLEGARSLEKAVPQAIA